MQLPNPKELKALFKVCREFGVDSVDVGELRVKFGEMPQEPGTEAPSTISVMPNDEELAYWSAQPDPLDKAREERAQ